MFNSCARWSISATEWVCMEWATGPGISADGARQLLGAFLGLLAVVWVGRRVIRYLSGPSSD